jgi:GMP synthase (glutamine-hydrolysing)
MLLIIDNQSAYIKQFKRHFLSENDIDYMFVEHNEPIIVPQGKQIKGIIISGGKGNPFEPLNLSTNYIALINYNVPTIGFCLGHEIIAVAFGGRIRKLAKYQKKKEKVVIDNHNDPIFKGITKKNLILQEKHSFEVSYLPDCFEVIAHSEVCPYEIIKHKERPVYGFQSHPEVSEPDGINVLKNFLKLCGLME